MKATTIATYSRKSTLWKNANAFYKAQDWTRMDCLLLDRTEERALAARTGMKYLDETGKDITEAMTMDAFEVCLANKSGRCTKSWEFPTREEANAFVKSILHHKLLPGWTRE